MDRRGFLGRLLGSIAALPLAKSLVAVPVAGAAPVQYASSIGGAYAAGAPFNLHHSMVGRAYRYVRTDRSVITGDCIFEGGEIVGVAVGPGRAGNCVWAQQSGPAAARFRNG